MDAVATIERFEGWMRTVGWEPTEHIPHQWELTGAHRCVHTSLNPETFRISDAISHIVPLTARVLEGSDDREAIANIDQYDQMWREARLTALGFKDTSWINIKAKARKSVSKLLLWSWSKARGRIRSALLKLWCRVIKDSDWFKHPHQDLWY